MRKKNRLLAIAAVVAIPISLSGTAQAELSANIGWASDYFYRGILQAPTSASAGLDYERGGFYAGIWAADVKDGLEVDGYFGYAREVNDVSLSLGFTGYYYTGDFDDTYQELNLGLGYGYVTVDVAIGEYDNFDAATQDYVYYALTVANAGLYGKFAGFGRDFDGEYVELGYEMALADLDIGFAAIFANSDLVGRSSESLVFSIGKSFDIH